MNSTASAQNAHHAILEASSVGGYPKQSVLIHSAVVAAHGGQPLHRPARGRPLKYWERLEQ